MIELTAQQKHYRANKSEYQERIKLKRRVFRKIIVELKLDVPCVDCDVAYPPWIMQFDHLPGVNKCFELSDVPNISSALKLLEEIDKCEIVCANCHADRTYQRRQE